MNTNLNDKLFALNIPTTVIELTQPEADELGAFEEDALPEQDALEASETETDEEA